MNQPLILKNGRIADTVSGKVLPPTDILTSNSIVQEIGHSLHDGDAGTKTLDCSGKYVIPGFFECHTHLSVLRNQPVEVEKEIFDECRIDGEFCGGQLEDSVLPDYLRYGVTQVRDLGGPAPILRDLKERTSQIASAGPDIFYAGPMLVRPPSGSMQMNERWPGWAVPVESPERVPKIVESLAEDGSGCMKLYGGFDDTVIESLVEHAAHKKLPITCDPGPTFFHDLSVLKGLTFGIRCFEHAKSLWYPALKEELRTEHDRLRDKPSERQNAFTQRLMKMGVDSLSMSKLASIADKMAKSHALLCPTLNVFKFFAEKPEVFSDKEPEKFGPIFSVLFEVGCQIVSVLAERGVRMLVGTDSYIPRFTQDEFALLDQNDVPALEILRGATLYPATWLGLDDLYGSVAVGKKANLVIVDSDPLDDIANMCSVHTVIRQGEVVYTSN